MTSGRFELPRGDYARREPSCGLGRLNTLARGVYWRKITCVRQSPCPCCLTSRRVCDSPEDPLFLFLTPATDSRDGGFSRVGCVMATESP